MERTIKGVIACVQKSCLNLAAIAAAAFMISTPALAQNDKMVPTPPQADAIVLGTGPLPGATAKESWHRQYEKSFARNVTIATLTPFLPDPAKASGAAVIVAPGGGFRALSMENEGSDVARALAARGIAAFVLKYRLVPTPPDMADFDRSMAEIFASAARPGTHLSQLAPSLEPQLADSRAAFALIRKRSQPDRDDRLFRRSHADAANGAP